MSQVPIENLRAVFMQSIIATLASQVGAYLRLISHPEAQLLDLLNALDRGPVIADDAARRLHTRMGLPAPTATPIVRRSYWEQMLKQRGVDPYEPIRPTPNAPAKPAVAGATPA